jgi:hypothetical protein
MFWIFLSVLGEATQANTALSAKTILYQRHLLH